MLKNIYCCTVLAGFLLSANSFSSDSDISRGETLYQDQCRSCHTSTIGRFFSGSPEITHLPGEYLLSQLEMFASGERQASDDGKQKMRMVATVKALSVQERQDIVAYIESNYQATE